ALNICLDREIVNTAAAPAFLLGGVTGAAARSQPADDRRGTSAERDWQRKDRDNTEEKTIARHRSAPQPRETPCYCAVKAEGLQRRARARRLRPLGPVDLLVVGAPGAAPMARPMQWRHQPHIESQVR